MSEDVRPGDAAEPEGEGRAPAVPDAPNGDGIGADVVEEFPAATAREARDLTAGASDVPGECGADGRVEDAIALGIAAELGRIRRLRIATWVVAFSVLALPIVCFSLFPPANVFGTKRPSDRLVVAAGTIAGRTSTATGEASTTGPPRSASSTTVPPDGQDGTAQTVSPGMPGDADPATTSTTSRTTRVDDRDSASTSSTAPRRQVDEGVTSTSSSTTTTARTSTSTSTSSTTTTSPPAQPQQLGGVDLGWWCQQLGFVRVSLDEQNGYGWHCVDTAGGRHAIDTFEACEHQYGVPDGLAVGQLTNYFDPNSWVCWRITRSLGPLSEANFRSWCRSAGYVDVRLNGTTAYDWDCIDSAGRTGGPDVRESCRYIYSSPAAIEVLANYFDPAGWRCYT